MLDVWIIEKIKEREKEKEAEDRPQIRCPVPEDYPLVPARVVEEKPVSDRGVFIIKIGYNDEEE